MRCFFSLSKDVVVVKGAKHSVVIDLKNEKMFRINDAARSILELASKGLTLEDVVAKLETVIDPSDTRTFIAELTNKGLVYLSETPSTLAQEEKPAPKLNLLWIEVTSRCNLRCVHCYAKTENENSQHDEIAAEEIIRVIDEAAALGCQDIQFTGGEATLRLDLRRLVEHAVDKGFDVEVFTNGTLLDKPMVKFFKEKGVSVAMSIYSYRAETHDAITSVPGSHARTVNSLDLLQANGVAVRCSVVAMKQNESELEETSNFLSSLGVLKRLPDPIRPTGRAKGLEHWPTEYGKNYVKTEPNFLVGREAYERNRWWNSCWFGKAAVTARGDVLPCVFSRNQIVGNVRQHSLTEIINGKDMMDLWSLTSDKIDVCRDCEYRYVCEDCRPWANGFTGNLYAKSPKCTYNPYTGEWGDVNGNFGQNSCACGRQ